MAFTNLPAAVPLALPDAKPAIVIAIAAIAASRSRSPTYSKQAINRPIKGLQDAQMLSAAYLWALHESESCLSMGFAFLIVVYTLPLPRTTAGP